MVCAEADTRKSGELPAISLNRFSTATASFMASIFLHFAFLGLDVVATFGSLAHRSRRKYSPQARVEPRFWIGARRSREGRVL